jgi:hypothetical protein
MTETAPQGVRQLRFTAQSADEAQAWQVRARQRLTEILMGGGAPERVPAEAAVLGRVEPPGAGYRLEELSIRSLSDRAVHCWLAIPHDPEPDGGPAILGLHGHGGTGEQMVRGEGLYWYGKTAAERGYCVIAPDIGSHDLQHDTWTLMGERTWDALVCLDYLAQRPEVDPARIGTIGLSLGGETVMYVAALDERLQVAVSSGWLTTVENMKNGHCPCWNSPGLEEALDFSDIFACVAPRHLVLEIGRQETAPGGFPAETAQQAFAELKAAYRAFGSEDSVALDLHGGGHEFVGTLGWPCLAAVLGGC